MEKFVTVCERISMFDMAARPLVEEDGYIPWDEVKSIVGLGGGIFLLQQFYIPSVDEDELYGKWIKERKEQEDE
jgi:hypothetical protein